jgi:O-antigen/teichoic acid export membrane protein
MPNDASRPLSRATTHSAVLVAAFALTAVVNYAFGVTMSWFFTPAQFGVLGVAQSLLLLAALAVGSGFAWTTAHDIAGVGVTELTRDRFRTAWLSNVLLGLLIGGGLWGAYALGWIPLGPAYRWVVPLVGLAAVLLAARSVVNGVVRGLYRFGALAVNQVGEVIIKSGMGLAFVLVGTGVAGVMAGFALGTAAALVHSLWVTRSAKLWRGPKWVSRGVVAGTAPLFVGMFGTAMMLNLDILGLKLLTPAGGGDELAGYYQAAVILARTPVFVAQSLTLVLFSYVAGSRRESSGQSEPESFLWDAIRAWGRLLLPTGIVLALAPGAALALFFPARYEVAASSLRVAAGGGVLLALVTLLTAVFQAGGERRQPAIVAALATGVQLVVLVWLVPLQGALGAAFSLLAAGATALLGLVPLLRTHGRRARLRPIDRPWSHLLRAALPLVLLVLALLLLPDGGRPASLLKLVVAGTAYLLALVGMNWWAPGHEQRPSGPPLVRFMHLLLGGS